MNFIKKSDEAPELLVITPLRNGDVVHEETINSIMSNSLTFDWISLEGDGNPYKNTEIALKIYERMMIVPPLIIKMDNDIVAMPGMLDKMKEVINASSWDVGYVYCEFRFTGAINAYFPVRPFDSDALKRCNYISSMSMMKTTALNDIDGFVTDDKYFRLLDWALWLKFLNHGYIGQPVSGTSFIAKASKNSVSAGTSEDYRKKASLVIKDFVMNSI